MQREHRLRSRADVREVLGRGQRVTRPEFLLYHFAREMPAESLGALGPRVGFSVSRRLGGAVIRNRVRRLLREACRPLLPRLAACDIVVVARPAALEATVGDLERELTDAAARAGILRT